MNDDMRGSVRSSKKNTGNDSHSSCAFCGESILPHEMRSPIEAVSADGGTVGYHYECGFRNTMGSVGHLRGDCPCNGQEDVSEVGMTRRQAAKAAWAYFQTHKKQTGHQIGGP